MEYLESGFIKYILLIAAFIMIFFWTMCCNNSENSDEEFRWGIQQTCNYSAWVADIKHILGNSVAKVCFWLGLPRPKIEKMEMGAAAHAFRDEI